MEKHLLPILCTVITIVIWSVFKPTSEITYQDYNYINNLKTCSPYRTEGKILMIGLENSTSIIQGAKNGRCHIQTINKFILDKKYATSCALNKSQLTELATARQSRVYELGGYNDAKVIARLKKENVCTSYIFKDQQWVKAK